MLTQTRKKNLTPFKREKTVHKQSENQHNQFTVQPIYDTQYTPTPPFLYHNFISTIQVIKIDLNIYRCMSCHMNGTKE